MLPSCGPNASKSVGMPLNDPGLQLRSTRLAYLGYTRPRMLPCNLLSGCAAAKLLAILASNSPNGSSACAPLSSSKHAARDVARKSGPQEFLTQTKPCSEAATPGGWARKRATGWLGALTASFPPGGVLVLLRLPSALEEARLLSF